MSGFVEQLMLAERAAENIYFAKVNRELIESLHKRMRADKNFLSTCPQNVEAQAVNRPIVLKGTGGS
jgi:hypothetical protein